MATESIPQKQCSRCKLYFPSTTEYFARNKASKDGLKSACKNCTRAEHKEYYATNTEKCLAASDAWEQKNKEYVKTWCAKYYQEQKEIYYKRGKDWRVAHIEQSRQHDKTWRDNHPEKIREKFNKRRNAPGSHTAKDIKAQYLSQKGLCWWCGKPVKDNYHVDHINPLSRGGSNNPNNLVISCPTCNTSRQDKLPHEWSDRLI